MPEANNSVRFFGYYDYYAYLCSREKLIFINIDAESG